MMNPNFRSQRASKPHLRLLWVFAAVLISASFAHGQTYADLYDFGNGNDGSSPNGTVTFDSNGNMYGTTTSGGVNGLGDVWEITNSGTYVELYDFGNGSDGILPYGAVTIDSNGNLYGTAAEGGANGKGIIWEISSNGTYADIHDFGSGSDGRFPQAGVTIDGSGNLYGTAQSGGANGLGIIWKLSSTGTYSDIHDFGSGNDGRIPSGSITLDGSGNLYGTASAGGLYGGGIIWKLTGGGSYTDLHDFGLGTDGQDPEANVTFDGSGNLYGTAYSGGVNSDGIIWKLSAGGTYSDLHDFGVGLDGQNPSSGITIDSSGNLYGTASNGGSTGNGLVWEITTTGTYSDVHDFGVGSDGQNPLSSVTIDSYGNLYGTAAYGGVNASGNVWELAYKPTTLKLSASSVSGGTSVLGIIRLEVPVSVPTTITLASNSISVVVPPTITVPVGSQYVTFPIWTDPVVSGLSSTISAANGANVPTATLNLTPYSPLVFGVQVRPTFVTGGASTTGLVQLDHFVTTIGGEVVDLNANNVIGGGTAAATVPASVVVPFGTNGVNFPIATSAVTAVTAVSINATDTGTQSGLVILTPPGVLDVGLAVNLIGINGGNSAIGTVTFSAAQSSDTVVNLSSNVAGVTVPASVTVPAGSTAANFTILTSPVSALPSSTNGGLAWIACSVGLSSQAFPEAIFPAFVHYMTISPSSVTGGVSSTGTVVLIGAAPSGGDTVTLASSSPDAQVPASVFIPAGSSSATFPITTSRINSNETLNITASLNGTSANYGMSLSASTGIHYVSISPSTVTGGTGTVGTVFLTQVAPSTGTTVTLASSDPSAQVPLSVTIPGGSLSTTFAITTTAVSVNTNVSISSTLNGHSANSGLVVAAPSFTGLSFAGPTSIVAGTPVTVTASLNGPAPSGGTVITLSSNSTSAIVPPTVTIPAGSTSTTFVIQTTTVSSTVSVTITGVHTQTSHLTFKLTHS